MQCDWYFIEYWYWYFIELKKIKALKGAAMPVLQRTTFKKEMHVYLNNCGQYTKHKQYLKHEITR